MPAGFSTTWRHVLALRVRDIVHLARKGVLFVVTCVHAARYLPTVRGALPWYLWPLLAVASAAKAMPVDFGVDEVLFALAFGLIAWRRPGLLRALYREAQAGKPAPCRCPRHAWLEHEHPGDGGSRNGDE